MSAPERTPRDQLIHLRKVADMLCTGHAVMRDRYALAAQTLDLVTLFLTSWLVALAFVDPLISNALTPFHLRPTVWIGLLSFFTFCLTLLQMRTGWKACSDAHARSLQLYAEVKKEIGYLLALGDIDSETYKAVCSRYDLASRSAIEISEKKFLRLKRHHLLKISISKYLEGHPGASIAIFKVRQFWKDNFAEGEK